MLMPLRRPGVTLWSGSTCRLLAALLVLGSAAWHLFYLTHHCSLDLAPDEAHYWDWSRHLDWSYYSKGPLVAWLIRLSCELTGPWSLANTGTLMPAVRLPAVLCGSLMLLALYLLTVQVYGREGLALAVVAAALTLPVIAAGSSIMTIDAPFTCCWAWALVFGHRAVFPWLDMGLAVGRTGSCDRSAGQIHHDIVAGVPGAIPADVAHSSAAASQPRLLEYGGRGSLGGVPILIWNAQHDWVTVYHLSTYPEAGE